VEKALNSKNATKNPVVIFEDFDWKNEWSFLKTPTQKNATKKPRNLRRPTPDPGFLKRRTVH